MKTLASEIMCFVFCFFFVIENLTDYTKKIIKEQGVLGLSAVFSLATSQYLMFYLMVWLKNNDSLAYCEGVSVHVLMTL